jgi:hypothetical protein
MDIQIDGEIHHLSFFRCIGYKSDFPFLYYPNAQLLSVAYGIIDADYMGNAVTNRRIPF